MMLIPCPNCGPRHAGEFAYVGETGARPDPATTTATEWRNYLYLRHNRADWTVERWYHRMGCRRYFLVERNTVTHEIRPPS
ncbi:sarcosine oxidase subunit delta [Nocardioides sp. InS609-2]|uniref:sarcosine oxidase subunit delta n=1 Tax=Nocardioides sp. InS609-2 TaxID=2760705 RepID=UPI0020C1657B|nr:sarcosine oxidase subunit delta [Nocardioides sp. InS609-2]